MSALAVALTFALALAPLAGAGTAGDPEVTDPTNDTRNSVTGAETDRPGQDLTDAWFVENPDTFEVHWTVRDLETSAETQRFLLEFDASGESFRAKAQRSPTEAFGSLRTEGGPQGPNTFEGTAAATFDDASDEVTLTLPRNFTVGSQRFVYDASTTLSDPLASAWAGQGTAFGGGVFVQYDEAGPGEDFTFATGIDEGGGTSALALEDHECDPSEWHFVVNQLDERPDAPASIHVAWANGDEALLFLEKVTDGGVAHYASSENLGSEMTEATAHLPEAWEGNFRLSHGPDACGDL